jgi:hypothetical protein
MNNSIYSTVDETYLEKYLMRKFIKEQVLTIDYEYSYNL